MKLTREILKSLVRTETFFTHKTLTVCVLELASGAMVTGESNVLDPANYDAEIGRNVAREMAIGKMWSLEGYAVKSRGQ